MNKEKETQLQALQKEAIGTATSGPAVDEGWKNERLKIKLRFAKFVLATVAAGIISTVVQWQLKNREIDLREGNTDAEFLEKFLGHAMDVNLERRLRFAQYFARLTKSQDSRELWAQYYEELLVEYNGWEQSRKELLKRIENAPTEQKAKIEEEIRDIDEEIKPRRTRVEMQKGRQSGADLSGADLSGANLRLSNFVNANLSQTNLSEANLSLASLNGCNLTRANLSKTNLSDANLYLANLKAADLRAANLERVRNWRDISDIANANIMEVKDAPDGFREWALGKGAVEMPADAWDSFMSNGK